MPERIEITGGAGPEEAAAISAVVASIEAEEKAALAVSRLGFDLAPIKAHAQLLKTQYAKETTTICCYCAVGCGAIVHTSKQGDGRVINIEGDPDHVINRGALCSKGASLRQLVENENRLTEPTLIVVLVLPDLNH